VTATAFARIERTEAARLRDRADLMFCLGRALLPPPAEVATREWCEWLADDLDELAAALGLDASLAISRLREAAGAAEAAQPWLVAYSRLFLVPPVAVTLNTGVYLEGGLAGMSAQMLTECYRLGGFERRETFRDLPDHAAMQLEFVAALLERAAGGDGDAAAMADEFIATFVVHWVGALRAACARATVAPRAAAVYEALADLLARTIGVEAG
jgi:TorA maturation chaperone TorD